MDSLVMNIKTHNGISVLRDDTLPGGTKSILLEELHKGVTHWIYPSSPYGGLQIALSHWCKEKGKECTIVTTKRKELHPNTRRCMELGSHIIQVPYGYLRNLKLRADKLETETHKVIPFGLDTHWSRKLIAERMREITNQLGKEPTEIWCAVGSGVLVEGILLGTDSSHINGVIVGKEYINQHERLTLWKYPKPFEWESKYPTPFQSVPNYDRKTWEFCNLYHQSEDTLFWNVY